MLKYCLKKWDKNKGNLERELRARTDLNMCEYLDLVKLVAEYILCGAEDECGRRWDYKHITVVDDGSYQGTKLFLIPRDTYQPAEYEYLMTFVDYGSCSGCDTLLHLQAFGDDSLTEMQVKGFMALCKDLVTNMIKPFNCGWRNEEEFDEVKFDDESEADR